MWQTTRKKKLEKDDTKKDNNDWITVNGVHIPIKPGQNKDDVVKNFLDKQKDKEPKKDTPKKDDKKTTVTKGAGYDDWKKKQLSADQKKKQSNDWWEERERIRNAKKNKDIDIIPSTEIPEELRPSGKNYRVEAEKARLRDKISSETEFIDTYKDRLGSEQIKSIKLSINQYKKDLDNVEINDKKLDLPNIPMKANTHTKNTDGFIHDKSKITLQKAVKENPGTKLMSDRVKSAWNNLPDEHRNLVDNLVIKQSRAKKSTQYKGGTWNKKTKTLTLHLNSRSASSIEHNFYHEIGHARYNDIKTKNPEKIEAFGKKVKELGISPTAYSESYKDSVIDQAKRERKYRNEMKAGGFTVSAEAEEILERNRKGAKDLYENETHSELNAYVLGNLPKQKIRASPESMKKLLNAYKELHEL